MEGHDEMPLFLFGKWVVSLCAFTNYGFAISMPFSMSTMFVSWQEEFQGSRAHTAAVFSINVSMIWGAGIIPGYVMSRFGARVTVLIGTFLASLSYFLSFFATSINFLIFSYSILGGMGLCFIQLPSMPAINGAFSPRYRTLAVSICTCSISLLSMGLPYMCMHLIHQYTWRGAILILSSILFQTAAFGLAMTSVSKPLSSVNQSKEEESNQLVTENKALNIQELDIDKYSDDVKSIIEDTVTNPCNEVTCNIIIDEQISETRYHENPQQLRPPENGFHGNGGNSSDRTHLRRNKLSSVFNKIRNSRFEFLLDLKYILLMVHFCTSLSSTYTLVLLTIDMTRTKGFDESTGVFFMFLLFLASSAGRLIVGAMSFVPHLHSISILGIATAVNGVAMVGLANATEYTTLVAFILLEGLGSGGMFAIYTRSVLDADSVTLKNYPLALGMSGTIESGFDLVLPVLFGYTADVTGSYRLILNIFGTICIATALVLVAVQTWSTYKAIKKTSPKLTILYS